MAAGNRFGDAWSGPLRCEWYPGHYRMHPPGMIAKRSRGGQAQRTTGRLRRPTNYFSRQDAKAVSLDRRYFPTRASSRMCSARTGLKMPQVQKRARQAAARSGSRRPSFTKSIIFFAMVCETMPWPHMVDSSRT